MSIEKIKMGVFLQNGSNIYSGRDKGIDARRAIRLEDIEQKDAKIVFLIPNHTWGINPSFYGGLLEGTIKKFLKNIDAFQDKYLFLYYDETELNDSLKADLQEGLRYVLNGLGE